jgi:tRNA pseudouridine13 synthase
MTDTTFESHIGINTFFTQAEGIGGKLRTFPEDFVVNELFRLPKEVPDGRYAIAEVFCRNWETHMLIRELSKRLHISRKRIGFAGTKDKRACTTQLMSFYRVPFSSLAELTLKDVTIKPLFYTHTPIKLGDLVGNRFDISLRDIDRKYTKSAVEQIVTPVINSKGFPNFFGIQRFGTMRPINHTIGKYILQEKYEEAVMTYVANPIVGEPEEIFSVRSALASSHDFKIALREYPEALSFEKAILNRLIADPNDYVQALLALPKNLLIMFINAYQSYLFNKILSRRLAENLPLNKALVGDIILPVGKQRDYKKEIMVTDANQDKVNVQIGKGHAFISGVLFGNESEFSGGIMGQIEREIIQNEQVTQQDFIIPAIPFLSSSGSRRSLLSPLDSIEWELQKDDVFNGKQALHICFSLQKGSYATSLLREFMKADDAKNY